MDTCPKCIGERISPYGTLKSTIRYKRKDGYMFCKICGRRWPIKKIENKKNGSM